MKKRLIALLLIGLLLYSISLSAFAAAQTGYVTFTSAGQMAQENFDVAQVFSGLEPGDNASYNVVIKNSHTSTTRWYMSNTVLASLEQSVTDGRIAG